MADIRQLVLDNMVSEHSKVAKILCSNPANLPKISKLMRGIYYRHLQRLSDSQVDTFYRCHFGPNQMESVAKLLEDHSILAILQSVQEEASRRVDPLYQ